jgi:hypothetical protein
MGWSALPSLEPEPRENGDGGRHDPSLSASQPREGTDLASNAQPDRSRLTSAHSKMILVAHKIGAQCATNAERSPPCRQVSFLDAVLFER